jgi:hypothetical protein
MKITHHFLCIPTWIACFLLLSSTAAHAQPPASTEKLQNIRKLIVLLGALDMQKQSIEDKLAFLREEFPQLRGEEAEALAQKLDEKELQGLVDKLAAVYDKNLTDEEVSEMLKFYETPTGQKVARLLPQMREESRRIVQEWKQGLVRKVMVKPGGLIRAVTQNDTAAVNELLSSGADVNERNSRGVTPLMAAAHKGNLDLTKLLVEKGADVNATTPKGLTPLMAAVEAGNPEVVRFLLSKGADANMKEEAVFNAYQLAAMRNQHEIMSLLKDKTTDTKSARTHSVNRGQPQKVADSSQESIESGTLSQESSFLMQHQAPGETQGSETVPEPTKQPRIWWRHH